MIILEEDISKCPKNKLSNVEFLLVFIAVEDIKHCHELLIKMVIKLVVLDKNF